MRTELDCIVCPASCHIRIETAEGGEVLSVSGNGCKRGAQYACTEVKNPVRMVTGTVPVEGGRARRLPVVTSGPVPREKISAVMEEIHHIRVCAPVSIDDIMIKNVCGLGVDVKAGRSIGRRQP